MTRNSDTNAAGGRPRWRHVVLTTIGAVAVGAALVAALILPAGSARSSHSQSPPAHRQGGSGLAQLIASPQLPGDCQPKTWTELQKLHLPTHYELGFVAEVGPQPGHPSDLVVGPVRVDNITAKACGVATVINGSGGCAINAAVNVPADGQLFRPIKATITEIPGLTPQVPFSPQAKSLTSGLGCGSSVNGLQVSAQATVGGSANIFGLSCGVTLTIPLKATITGPIDAGLDLHGVFVASKPFLIPAVTASPTCPAGVAVTASKSFGLPLTAGTNSLSLPFSAAIYLPQ
jgi:hypothetical protein